MKFDKPSAGKPVSANGLPHGVTEIQMANMRMVYEDPEQYAKWRLRMALQPPAPPAKDAAPDPHGDEVRAHMKRLNPTQHDNPVMRARIAKMFLELGKGLEPPRSKRRPNYRSIEELADYARAPLTVSDEMEAFVRARNEI